MLSWNYYLTQVETQMSEVAILPVENEVSVDQATIPELDVSSLDSIETWYRNLRPDRDMRSVPLDAHLDATASAVLHATGRELPAVAGDRIQTALALTTDIPRSSREIALAGPQALVISDLLVELVERDKGLPKNLVGQLLSVSSRIAETMRSNPLLSPEDRVQASTRFYNAETAKLEHDVAGVAEDEKSDAYIALVRNEALWMSGQTRSTRTGTLFEVYIGCLTKYQIWTAEEDGNQTARHATLREDKPSPKRLGGSGFKTAHDVAINSRAGRAMLQCKWGSAAREFGADKYDETKIMPIVETGDEGILENNRDFEVAFKALAGSHKVENMDVCDSMSYRYRLPEIVDAIRTMVPRRAGALALANV